MTIAFAVRLTLLASIWLIVLSLGARASVTEASFVVRRPALLLRAVVAMFVIAPAFALLLAATTSLPAPIRFAIVAMSVAPIPPILPFKQMKAGGGADYAIGLLVAASIVAVLATPLLIALAARLLGAEAFVTSGRVARTLLISVALPLVVGMLARALSPAVAAVIGGHAQRLGRLLLLVAFAAMIVGSGREILVLLGNGSALAIAAAVGVGLAAGHLLGSTSQPGALALAAASRHPGVALAIAELSYPDQSRQITAAILIYLVVTALVTAPYVRWLTRRPIAATAPAAAAPS